MDPEREAGEGGSELGNGVSGEPRPASVKSKSLLSYAARSVAVAAGGELGNRPSAQPKPALAVGQRSWGSVRPRPNHTDPTPPTIDRRNGLLSSPNLIPSPKSSSVRDVTSLAAGRKIIGRTYRRIRRRPSWRGGCPCRSLRRRSSGTRRSTPRPDRA